jgi:hypothetical protein
MNRRYLVAGRALHRCEYCHAPEVVFNFPFEVEHIQPVSKDGTDEVSNLALACRSCNIFKSDDTEGFDDETHSSTRLFNPRVDHWEDHFEVVLESGALLGLTEIGRATTKTLRMNREVQLIARSHWIRLGLFPLRTIA